MELLWRQPARPAGFFLSSQQWVSAGAALSCPTTCPGQGDILPPFLEAELSGFLEEGRQDAPRGRRSRAGWGERMGRSGTPGQRWKNRFVSILGRPQDSKALSVFVTVSQGHSVPGFSEHQALPPTVLIPDKQIDGYH